MTADSDVDIIILSLNRVTETLQAIDSACAQTGLRTAVYVVDQGSAPENLQRIQAHIADRPSVHLTALGRNVGVPGGRNIAARAGGAPVIVAIDNDAEFATADTVARAVERLRSEPKLGAVAFRILNFETGTDDATSWGYPDLDWTRRHLEFPAASFVGAGHALRRKAFEEAGGYDERLFFVGEEIELGLKLLNIGYEIRYVGSIAIRHKVTAEARIGWDSGRHFYTMRNRIYLALKAGDSPWRILQLAVGLLIKAARRGAPFDALRGLADGLLLYARLPPEIRKDPVVRLKPATRALIDMLHYRQHYNVWDRLQNAWHSDAESARGTSRSRLLR